MSDFELKVEIEFSPSPSDEQSVWNGLRLHNDQFVPAHDVNFAVFLRQADGTICGGLLAKAGRGWLHINTLWVHTDLRGNGYGTKLLETAEEEARQRGCHSAYLDTFSFQALPFYKQCGYEVFGTLEDFPEGHQRYFMRKSIKT